MIIIIPQTPPHKHILKNKNENIYIKKIISKTTRENEANKPIMTKFKIKSIYKKK